MSWKAIDLTSQRFGRLMVLSRVENAPGRKTRWLCRCDCGKEKIVYGCHLRLGRTQSCGCLNQERHLKHGGRGTRLYSIWCGMKDRCYREKCPEYKNYGGRGITICEEWKANFEAFREWALSNGYSDEFTIDRKDVNGGYCPDNCRWATDKEQGNNKRYNRLIEYKGETRTLSEWSEIIGIQRGTLDYRLKVWSIEDAFNKPVERRNRAE